MRDYQAGKIYFAGRAEAYLKKRARESVEMKQRKVRGAKP